jgi:hypothetical protein
MRITTSLIPLLALTTAFACSKDEKAGKAEQAAKPAASATATPTPTKSGDNSAVKVGLDTGGKSLGGDPVQLSGLKFGGSGFEGEFNEALDSWTFEKWEPQKDGGNDNVVRLYIDAWDSEWPVDVEGFATKLGEPDFLDFGSKWPTIEAKTAFEGGWVITGETSDDEDTEKAFAVQLTKLRILCRGSVKATAKDIAASRTEAIEACKAATL